LAIGESEFREFRLALHEAGHCIADWHIGNEIKFVRVCTDSGGVSATRRTIAWDDPSAANDPEHRRVAEDLAMQLMAGEYAAAMLTDSDFMASLRGNSGSSSDYGLLLAALTGYPQETRYEILEAATLRLIALFGRDDVWNATMALAAEIDERRQLDGSDVVKIIECHARVWTQ